MKIISYNQNNVLMYLFILVAIFIYLDKSYCEIVSVEHYHVDVTVRNSVMTIIPDAKIKAFYDKYKKIIRLKASAKGYIYAEKEIFVESTTNQQIYKCDIILTDPKIRIDVVDIYGKVIQSAYIDSGQYGFLGNEYGITVFIPKKNWLKPSIVNVEIIDSFWGLAWKEWAKIDEVDEFYKVRLAMKRSAIFWCGKYFYVVFGGTITINEKEEENDIEKVKAIFLNKINKIKSKLKFLLIKTLNSEESFELSGIFESYLRLLQFIKFNLNFSENEVISLLNIVLSEESRKYKFLKYFEYLHNNISAQ